jgi:hypothetical protein
MTAGSSGAMMTHAAALAASIDVMQLQVRAAAGVCLLHGQLLQHFPAFDAVVIIELSPAVSSFPPPTQMSHMSSDSASVAARLEQVQQEAAEQKATHDALLNKANADAAEIKAMYDKVGCAVALIWPTACLLTQLTSKSLQWMPHRHMLYPQHTFSPASTS